jgi:hypothetical protein
MRARCEDGSCRNDDESERNAPILREHAPFGARWVPEIKFDGYRAQAHGIARIDGDAMEMSLPCQRLHGGARLRMRARCEDGSCRNDDESERNAVAMP